MRCSVNAKAPSQKGEYYHTKPAKNTHGGTKNSASRKGIHVFYIGIDPGKKGGIAVISGDYPDHYHTFPFSSEKLREIAEAFSADSKAVVEDVHAMPGQGVTSMFTFGKGFGYIIGVLEANSFPYQLVSPQRWKKEFSLSGDKASSIEVCKRLFPNANLKATERCKKDHDGMAEALLIAEYARRHL